MRDALAGRNYVADYVQTLTHEVKSPLSAIRGAAELLQEPMPDADRARFAANIVCETECIRQLVDRTMELTALESRQRLESTSAVPLRPLLLEMAASVEGAAVARGQRVVVAADPAFPSTRATGCSRSSSPSRGRTRRRRAPAWAGRS